jgi:hypothetical protein
VGGGAEAVVAAVLAADESCELVLAGAGGALVVGSGPGGGEVAGALPRVSPDDGRVGVADVDRAVGDVPCISGVGQGPAEYERRRYHEGATPAG